MKESSLSLFTDLNKSQQVIMEVIGELLQLLIGSEEAPGKERRHMFGNVIEMRHEGIGIHQRVPLRLQHIEYGSLKGLQRSINAT